MNFQELLTYAARSGVTGHESYFVKAHYYGQVAASKHLDPEEAKAAYLSCIKSYLHIGEGK